MDCRRCLAPIICAGVALLSVIAPSGCAVHSFQTVASPDAVDGQYPTCDLTVAQGYRYAADPQYHPTVWFPLTPPCPGKADPVEETQGTVVPLPDTNPEIDPTPPSAPSETDSASHSAAGGGENQASETSDEQDVFRVVPEPSWRDWPVPTDGQREEAGSSPAPETGT